MKDKPKIIRILTYLCLIGYFALALFLIYQATLDGRKSSSASNAVGNEIKDIIDDGKDNTKLVNPTSLEIKNPITEATVGEQYQIKATVMPTNSSYKSLIYNSSNESIATIDGAGNVEFLEEGIVSLKIWVEGFEEVSKVITITVNKIDLEDLSYVIKQNGKEIKEEDGYYLLKQFNSYGIDFEFMPNDATYKDVSYEYDCKYFDIENGVITVLDVSNDLLTIVVKADECSKIIKVKTTEDDYNIIPVEIEIKNPIKEAYVGMTHALEIEFLPMNTTYKSVSYKSSDTSIATVKSNGEIRFISGGEVVITAYNKDFSELSLEMVVSVSEVVVEDLNYSLEYNDEIYEDIDGVYELLQYESYAINIIVEPLNAAYETVAYEFDEEYLGILNGVITAKKPSDDIKEIVIKCDEITRVIKVKIKEVNTDIVDLIDISVETKNITLFVGETIKLSSLGVSLNPANVTFKNLTYETVGSGILRITASKIKGKKAGEDTLIITHEQSGLSTTVNVTVINNIIVSEENPILFEYNDYVFENDVYKISKGSTGMIKVNFLDSSTFTDVVYSTSNKDVVRIGEDGSFTPIGEGETIISAIIDDGVLEPIIYSIKIIVSNPVYTSLVDFDLGKDTIELYVGDKVQLFKNPFKVTYNPSNATNKSLNYIVLDKKVAKIESQVITALKAGTTEVKLINKESNIEKTVTIVVKNLIIIDAEKPFTIKQEYLSYDSSLNIYKIRNGYSGKIKVNFDKSSTFKEVSYSSKNTNILTVGKDGTITPLMVGRTSILITIDDGLGQEYTYEVTIEVERTPLIENLKQFFRMIRKNIGHFAAFFVLGMLGALSFSIIFDKKKWLFSIPMNFLLGFVFAGLTELIQTYVPGRYGCWDDVWLDISGYYSAACIFTIIVLGVYLILHMKKKQKTK